MDKKNTPRPRRPPVSFSTTLDRVFESPKLARTKQAGRTKGPGSYRSFSARPAPATPSATPSGSHTPLTRNSSDDDDDGPLLITSTSSHDPNPPSPSGSSAMKRPRSSLDENAPAEVPTKRKKRPRKPKKPKLEAEVATAAAALGGGAAQDEELEEGEIDGDFLFVVDTAPAVVRDEDAYVEAPLEEPVKVETVSEAQLEADEKERLRETEEEEMRVFKEEVAMDTESVEEEDEEEEEEEQIYDDPDALQAAIRGKITDDSAARVSGCMLELGGTLELMLERR